MFTNNASFWQFIIPALRMKFGFKNSISFIFLDVWKTISSVKRNFASEGLNYKSTQNHDMKNTNVSNKIR